MTFIQALNLGYISKTRKYLFPIINTYPQSFLRELVNYNIVSVGLEDDFFYIICNENPQKLRTFKFVKEVYKSLKLKKYIVVTEIVDKWKPIIPTFLEGKYSKLYNFDLSEIGIYPNKYNKNGIEDGPNYVYHVLRKTELGKNYFYQKLVERKYIDQNITKFNEFNPEEYDFPPKSYDLKIL